MLSIPNCTATLQHLVAATLAPSRGVPATELLADLAGCDDFRNGAAALDSLDQLSVARTVAEFFELDQAGTEEFLLRRTRLTQWSQVILDSLEQGTLTRFWFRSGGTSGEPRLIPQPIGQLLAEVREIGSLVASTRRIVALVPLHHIYGFIWGPLLSDHLTVPLIHGPEAIQAAHRDLQPGDLVVGVPQWWRYFANAHRRIPQGVTGVTSTAACPPSVVRSAIGQGLSSMLEIYGSSETAGIGWRNEPGQAFRLFRHWRKRDDDHLESETGSTYPLPDLVEWESACSLMPYRRRDDAVQVGGTNVWPDRLRAFIEQHTTVKACAVRPFETDNGTRLKAFVVPCEPADPELSSQLRDWLKANLSEPERPIRLTLGAELPRNAMGKLCDW